jgi:universal stress protein E
MNDRQRTRGSLVGKSILVVLERGGHPAPALARAVQLARRMDARVDLCLCEAEAAFALQHQFDSAATERARQWSRHTAQTWLERTWSELAAPDVTVRLEVVYESPMFEAVRRRAHASHPELVVRGIGTAAECTFSVADADLVRACPAPLLLTRGHSWRAAPTVAAALDISGEEPPELSRRVLLAADAMARCCEARLELLFAQPRADEAALRDRETQLAGLAAAANVRIAAAHVLGGDAAATITACARRREYELLVLGALAHRGPHVGSLTARLLEELDCDLLLVRPAQ